MSIHSAVRAGRRSRRLRIEPLEKRVLLDAAGLLATIDGTVFEDLDLDNIQGAGEPGLADWSVELEPTGGYLRSHYFGEDHSLGGLDSIAIEGGRYLIGEPGKQFPDHRTSEAFLFDLATGELLQTFRNPEDHGTEVPETGQEGRSNFGGTVAFAGRNVLIASDHGVYLFDSDTGELLQSFSTDDAPWGYPSLAGSDNRVLVGHRGYGDTLLYDAATGELLHTFAPPEDELGDRLDGNTIRDVELVDDKVLFSIGSFDTTHAVYIYDANTGQKLRTLEDPDPAWHGRLLDVDGDLAAIQGDEKAFVFDINTGELVGTFENPEPVYGMEYDDSAALVDGGVLLGSTGHGSDNNYGSVYYFDLETGELLDTFKHPQPEPDVSWSDPNTGQTYSEPGPGLIMHVDAGPEIFAMQNFGRRLAADGQYFLAGGHSSDAVHVFNTSGSESAGSGSVTTDGDGNFQLDGVEPGNYRVRVEPPESSTDRWIFAPADRTLAISAGEDLENLDWGSYLATSTFDAVDVGTVAGSLEIEDIDLSAGDQLYSFQTEQGTGGRLLSLATTDTQAVIELYDAGGFLLATGSEGRLDWHGVVSPDSVGDYYCYLSGSDAAVKLNIVNLIEFQSPDAVDQPGRTVKVWGTPNDDLFEFNAQQGTFQYYGMEYDLETELFKSFFGRWNEPISVEFAGGYSAEDGHDTARIIGTCLEDQAIELRPQWGSLTIDPFVYPQGYEVDLAGGRGYYHEGLNVTAAGAEVITIDANGDDSNVLTTYRGESSAVFHDSPGNDLFVATPTYAGLSGDAFKSEVFGSAIVRAYASAGGSDVAKMFDSAGNDLFVAAPAYGNLSGEGFNNEARGFAGVHAYATAGGIDTAKLFDSATDDIFYADPVQGALYQPGVYYNRAKHFEGVHAYAVAGGNDVARLFGSAGDDLLYASPVQAALYRPDAFYNRAKHFEEVYGDGRDGNDRAELHDSALNDLLEAEDSWVKLSNLDLGSLQQAANFARAKAFTTTGTNRRDIADPLTFVLEYDGTWTGI